MKKHRKSLFAMVMLVLLLNVNFVSAAVVYDEDTDRYYSTSVEDGVLCFNGSVFDDKGMIVGSNNNMKYLENIIPTDDDVATLGIDKPKSISSDSRAMQSVTYTCIPQNKFFIFKLDGDSNHLFNVEIVNNVTDEVVARGNNLEMGKKYKLSTGLVNVPIDIVISSIEKARMTTNFEWGSTDDRDAEECDISDTSQIEPRYVTGLVPKNKDGGQGKIMYTYTMSKPQSTVKWRLSTKFNDSTNGMQEINIDYDILGYSVGYMMNLPLGYSYLNPTRFGIDEEIGIKLSTNSTSGKATLSFAEQL